MPATLTSRLPEFSATVRAVLSEEINAGAVKLVEDAQALAPVKTGFLRDSIQQTEAASPESLQATVRVQAPYAGFVEYGTSKMAPQPFFTPAIEALKARFKNLRFDIGR